MVSTNWIWNDSLDLAECKRQIEAFAKAGRRDIYLHTEEGYGGERWADHVRQCVHKAASCGHRVWLWDHLPFCGALSVPAYRQKQLVKVRKAQKGDEILTTVTERGAEYAICLRQTNRLDVLNPSAVSVFLNSLWMPVQRACHRQFGEELAGFVTGQRRDGVLLWTEELFSAFEKQWGWRLEDNLPALFTDSRTRLAYEACVDAMYEKAFIEPYKALCKEHGMALCGPDARFDKVLLFMEDTQEQLKTTADAALQLEKPMAALLQTGGYAARRDAFADALLLGAGEWIVPSLYSERQERKKQPNFSFQSSLWGAEPAYVQNEEALLSAVQGTPKADYLVVRPCYEAMPAVYQAYGEAALTRLLAYLDERDVQYHCSTEAQLGRCGSTKQGRLQVGRCEYAHVLVPPCETLQTTTLSLLEAAASVTLLAPYPWMANGQPDKVFLTKAVRLETMEELNLGQPGTGRTAAYETPRGRVYVATAAKGEGTFTFEGPYMPLCVGEDSYTLPTQARDGKFLLPYSAERRSVMVCLCPAEPVREADCPAFYQGFWFAAPKLLRQVENAQCEPAGDGVLCLPKDAAGFTFYAQKDLAVQAACEGANELALNGRRLSMLHRLGPYAPQYHFRQAGNTTVSLTGFLEDGFNTVTAGRGGDLFLYGDFGLRYAEGWHLEKGALAGRCGVRYRFCLSRRADERLLLTVDAPAPYATLTVNEEEVAAVGPTVAFPLKDLLTEEDNEVCLTLYSDELPAAAYEKNQHKQGEKVISLCTI